ncbi:SDR family oxidoreductase [Pseudonocardia spinosispora]|uniref:SDR family oxidoreductase n=1 Tax=Pseudonocardia spinosispora TaxID=103441 RepID=UPI003CCB7DC9
MGSPWDVAAAAVFLASAEASYINGVCLPVDGGVEHVAGLDPELGVDGVVVGQRLGGGEQRQLGPGTGQLPGRPPPGANHLARLQRQDRRRRGVVCGDHTLARAEETARAVPCPQRGVRPGKP